jgi:acyl-coenzyme A thioesterase PaaI-like protein
MGNSSYPKAVRLRKLAEHIKENPFVTDEELAKLFKVSIQTIRLDRLELRIPEVRERTKLFAERSYSQVKSLAGVEIIGELLDIELEKLGLSLLEITSDMVFQKNNIARGHILFAQANSLAVAIINAEVALTGASKVSFIRPVRLGEKIVAKAVINSKTGKRYNISVTSKSNNETVFTGEFRVFAMEHREDVINEDRS